MTAIDTIYVERAARDHPRSEQILRRFAKARVIECENHAAIFNRKQQNFRSQKLRPALILALKHSPRLYEVPAGQHLGAKHNYYFSHLLNCPFDCRYCFLQGMFGSANYVLFVNYEDFFDDIVRKVAASEGSVHLFSGYDCDSLALEPLTGFAEHFVAPFAGIKNAALELRTKSTQIRTLLSQPAHDNCIMAMSLAPDVVIDNFEHGTPRLNERLKALLKLQQHGWPVGLRFDPLVDFDGSDTVYRNFFDRVFSTIDRDCVHSATLGGLRLPRGYAKRMIRLYPDEPLFATRFDEVEGVLVAAGSNIAVGRAASAIGKFLPSSRIFVQHTAPADGDAQTPAIAGPPE